MMEVMTVTAFPDAPYIVKAQQEGIYSPDPVYCPICGKRAELIYLSPSEHCVDGCDKCVKRIDAYEWAEEKQRRDFE